MCLRMNYLAFEGNVAANENRHAGALDIPDASFSNLLLQDGFPQCVYQVGINLCVQRMRKTRWKTFALTQLS